MREMMYVEALNEALREEMRRDPTVIVFGEETRRGVYKATSGLYEEFGHWRALNTPISESAIAGAAVGAAVTGIRPVAEMMFGDLSLLAMDQIVNQAAKMRYMFGGTARLPLVVRLPSGGGRRMAAQHSQCLEALFCHIPGLKVVMPTTAYDAKGLMKSAIRDDNPVIFVESRELYRVVGEVPEEEYLVPLGTADVKRPGRDLTIVALGSMVPEALKAADELAQEGIEAEVIDPRTLVPLDKQAIFDSVQKTGRVVVAHEAVVRSGFGAEIAALIADEAFDYLDSPVKRVGAAECPVPYAPELEQAAIPHAADILRAARSIAPRARAATPQPAG